MKLRTPENLHGYQKKAVNFQCSRQASMMWLDMGLGKTAITLTSIVHLLGTQYLNAVLIVAPIRVCRLVWRQEALKWQHTKDLTFSVIVGTKDQRTRALMRPANVYLINFENLQWLSETMQTYFIKKNRPLPFNGLVWDEISKMKNSTTNRVKAVKGILEHFKWITGLTGTPASNGYKDLHGQFLVVDRGERLGVGKTQFKTRFFKKVGPFKEVAYPDTEEVIKHLIGDITLEMSAEDYNPLPDMIVNNIEVELPEDLRAKYAQMERDLFVQLDSGVEVEMFNQASLMNKCLAEGTEILTSVGWTPIEQYNGEPVWDGEEWVSTCGLLDNGYMPVIHCYGAFMTPDHKVLTSSGWRTASEVMNGKPSERLNRAEVRLPDSYSTKGVTGKKMRVLSSVMGSTLRLRSRINNGRSKSKNQPAPNKILRLPAWGSGGQRKRFSRDDRSSSVGELVQHAIPMQQPLRQGLSELRRTWDNCLPGMGQLFCSLLGGHGSDLSRGYDIRTPRQQQGVFEGELPMAINSSPIEQPSNQCVYRHPYREDKRSAGRKTLQSEPCHYLQEDSKGMARGCSDSARRVFDIANAGPRHRFVARGPGGDPFISHNCLQFSNGAMYPVAGMPLWEPLHDLKLDALGDILDEAQGQPVLCSYAYRSDAERIMKRFESLRPINLTECKSESSLRNAMERWKSGDCALMIGHAASMGHGVDGLQERGHTLVWFGLNWSLDLYEQFNARIRRQGQGVPVICHRILTRDTLDQAQAMALDDKATTQQGLRKAVKQYRVERGI